MTSLCHIKKTTSGKTPSKFAILSHVKSSDLRFVTWLLLGTVAKKCSVKKVFLEISQNSQENISARVTFFFLGLTPAALLKKRIRHRCFPLNFVKFLRTPFLTEHLWWLLLLIHVISQVWSPTTIVWSFPNKKWVILSHFSLVEKGIWRLWTCAFEANMSKKTF